jgi:hypothetical protein
MFRALLVHLQETLHKRSYGVVCGCRCGLYLGLASSQAQPTSTPAHNTYKNCICVLPSEDGQVMPETCRGFEPEKK